MSQSKAFYERIFHLFVQVLGLFMVFMTINTVKKNYIKDKIVFYDAVSYEKTKKDSIIVTPKDKGGIEIFLSRIELPFLFPLKFYFRVKTNFMFFLL